VTELGQLVGWLTLLGLILAARLLDTRPGRHFLRARIRPLADRWAARQRTLSEADQEFEELWAVMRREQLSAHLQRLRRIVATDESMSATRQIANRLAYRSIQHDLEKLAELVPWMADDETALRWTPSTYHSRPREVEVLEIGRRR
jgi:hypothetical protein